MAAGVRPTFAVLVVQEAFFGMDRNSGIEAIVRAKENINKIHVEILACPSTRCTCSGSNKKPLKAVFVFGCGAGNRTRTGRL